MNDLSIFLNNRVVFTGFRITEKPMSIGNVCLTPVRYLFNGKTVSIVGSGCTFDVDHKPSFERKTPAKTVAALALLLPGVILGAPFKLLSYLSDSNRWQHRVAYTHYTPIERVDVGSVDSDLESLKTELSEYKTTKLRDYKECGNDYHRPIKNLVIHVKEGTVINEDLGLEGLHLEKIILVGGRIIHQPPYTYLDDYLFRNGWKGNAVWNGNSSSTLVTQHTVASVEEALNSRGDKKRVFVVEKQTKQ